MGQDFLIIYFKQGATKFGGHCHRMLRVTNIGHSCSLISKARVCQSLLKT